MPILKKQLLERYLQNRFGPTTTLLSYGPIGKESSKGTYKQYGYGSPIRVTFQAGKLRRSAVLETMSPGPFGHEHMADRAQAILWDYESYGRLPRHVKALDVGAFTSTQALFSVAKAREFFVLTEWVAGASYHDDLHRLVEGGSLRVLDRRRTRALAYGPHRGCWAGGSRPGILDCRTDIQRPSQLRDYQRCIPACIPRASS